MKIDTIKTASVILSETDIDEIVGQYKHLLFVAPSEYFETRDDENLLSHLMMSLEDIIGGL